MKTNKMFKTVKMNTKAAILSTMLLFAIFPSTIFAADPPGIPDGWTDGFVYVNGARLHYYHAVPATGKPVIVMVHGVTDNGLCWTTLTWKLQKSYDIYMLDTRGHGLSDPITGADNGETLIKDVVGFVQAMKFQRPILMGHSMGAATVMRVGAEYPDLAQTVIMLDPFLARAGGDGRGAPRNVPSNNAPRPQKAESNTSKAISINMFGDPETLVKQNNYSFDDLVTLGTKQNPKWNIVDIKYWALSKKQYHGPYTPEAWQAMSGTMNIGDALAKITVPSLVLKADASPEARKANEDGVKELKKVKLVHVDGAAHNLHHDDLERTVKEIMDFLSQF